MSAISDQDYRFQVAYGLLAITTSAFGVLVLASYVPGVQEYGISLIEYILCYILGALIGLLVFVPTGLLWAIFHPLPRRERMVRAYWFWRAAAVRFNPLTWPYGFLRSFILFFWEKGRLAAKEPSWD